MTVLYHALLGETVITTANNRLRFTEAASTGNADLTPGSYFPEDLAIELAVAMAAAGASANVYEGFIDDFTIAAGDVHAVMGVGLDAGSDAFQLLWEDGATTLDAAAFGFEVANTALSTAPKIGTLTPSCIWVAPEPSARDDPTFEALSAQTRTKSGIVRTFDRGGPYNVRSIELQYISSERTFSGSGSFEAFWTRHRDGRAIQLHELPLTGDVELKTPASDTLVGTFCFDEATCAAFAPRRLSAGQELYGWTIGLREYVA